MIKNLAFKEALVLSSACYIEKISMQAMIETKNLGRYFGSIKAVDGISFSVKKGEVLGFLGPNGAGKSTTMKMLTCFLTPSFGTASVAGYDLLKHPREVRAAIGYLPENAPLYGEMTVEDFLKFAGEIRGTGNESLQSAVERVVDATSLEAVVKQRIETLSKGFRRRVGLAQALVHDPEILILDEPTDGLDPNQKHDVRMLINGMAKEKCIILSTHILEEVESVCSRVVIVAKGQIVADELPYELKRRSKRAGAVRVGFVKRPGEAIVSSLKNISGVSEVLEESRGADSVNMILIPDNNANLLSDVIASSKEHKWSYDDIQLESGQLDEVFRELTTV